MRLVVWLVLGMVAQASSAPGDPDCKGFGGMIHGRSTCVSYDQKTKRVVPSVKRVMPAEHPSTAPCPGELRLGAVRLELRCTGDHQHATVTVRFVVGGDQRDRAKSIVLDRYDGFHDFVNVWAKQDADLIRFTIDYGVLE